MELAVKLDGSEFKGRNLKVTHKRVNIAGFNQGPGAEDAVVVVIEEDFVAEGGEEVSAEEVVVVITPTTSLLS